MALFDPTLPDSSTGGFGAGLMGGGGAALGSDVGDIVSAIGQSMLTGTRQNWLGGFGQALAQQDKRREDQTSRAALVAALVKSGMSLPEAQTFALNPIAAKIAAEANEKTRTQAADRKAAQILGGGGDSPAAPGGPAAGASLNGGGLTPPTGTGAEIQNKFVGALKDGGLTNPNALGALAAYAQHESRYSPDNIVGSWSDPSQKGQAGTSGGILSWRNERLDNMRAATAGAKDPVIAQAQFTLNENPELTAKLQAARSPEEANALLADAWRFAGYDKPGGGEYARRLATTQSYASRFGQKPTQVADATGTAPINPVTRSDVSPIMPPGASGLNPKRPVQVADDENQTQVLEGRMGMYPRNVYGITPDPARQPADAPKVADAAADLPAPGAQPAEFRIPGGTAIPRPAGTVFDDKGKALQQLSLINRALAVPGLPDEMRRQLEGQREDAKAILKPTDNTRKLLDAGYQPGTPEFQDAARKLAFGEKDDREKIIGDANQRAKLADQYGFQKGTPEYANFVLGGKLPKDDRQPLSVADRNAILKADEAVEAAKGVISNLKDAKVLSERAFEGPTAGMRATIFGNLGSYSRDDARATLEYDNLITTNALGQLKTIFGGNPTEGERKILLEIQGSSSQPASVRASILKRAQEAVERRQAVMQERADEMRGGSYYKQGGGGGQVRATAPGQPPAAPAGDRQAGQGQAPSFAADELEAEARRRGLIQ